MMTSKETPRIPRAAKIDPLRSEKEAVAAYGDVITAECVTAIRRTFVGIARNKKGSAGDRAPIAAKHYTQGHATAMSLAKAILLEQLLEPGQPFEDLLHKWSPSGARQRVDVILRELESAITHGLWG